MSWLFVAEHLLNGLHDWQFEILLLLAEPFDLVGICFKGLGVNGRIATLVIVVTAQPQSDGANRSNLGEGKLLASDLRGVNRDLRMNPADRIIGARDRPRSEP